MSVAHDWLEGWEDGLLVRLRCARCGQAIPPVVVIVPDAEVAQVQAELPDRTVWGMSHLRPGHREVMDARWLERVTGKPECTGYPAITDGG